MDIEKLANSMLDVLDMRLVHGRSYAARVTAEDFLRELFAPPTVKFRWNKKLWPEGAPAPAYKTAGAVCADIVSAEDVYLYPGELKLVRTGLHIELPPNWECQVRPRSGLALHQRLTLNNSPGSLDWDYRGDVSAMVISHQPQSSGTGTNLATRIKRGDRIVQLAICRAYQADFVEVEELSDTERGESGFGSTGVR